MRQQILRFVFFVSLLGLPYAMQAQHTHTGAYWCAKHKCGAAGSGHFNVQEKVNTTDTRSDSVDILHIGLTLDITNFSGQTIAGEAQVIFETLVEGVQEIRLDLLGLSVLDVISPESNTYTYDGSVVKIIFAQPLSLNHTTSVLIKYTGQPDQDASGWGGFYWQNGYAYNLGVGFQADPHNFGRVWFPCFDNFVERATMETTIICPNNKLSFGNGNLVADSIDVNSGNRVRTWRLDEPIPSYLACVAVGPYVHWERTFQGENGPVPVEIAVAASDSTRLRQSFEHLDEALEAYEFWYGPYEWPKIGYSVVPFQSGAMEHATNIAYMRPAVDGTLGFERLMAHELSHHWWGDLATCSTAEDMWLNEGWASFSEHLFVEWLYGKDAYRAAVEENFLDVLQTTHIDEGGYRAVSGLPHSLTYGSHVYNKGAVVAHNLRGYLGDTLFRQGIRTVMEQTRMDDWSSEDLRDRLTAATGYDLSHFFADQVFQPGFMDYVIDSVVFVSPPIDTYYIAQIYVQQKKRGAPNFYQQVPLEFTFVREDGTREYRTGIVSGQNSMVEFNLPLDLNQIVKYWVNTRLTLTQARSEQERTFTAATQFNFTKAKMDIKVNTLPDTSLIRVEHHFAEPDNAPLLNPYNYALSTRFWVVDGLWADGLDATATIFYDGRGQQDNLDRLLFVNTSPSEDSVRLLYRASSALPWAEYPNYTKNMLGSTQDRWGQIKINQLRQGQYTIGKGVSTSSAPSVVEQDPLLRINPNPSVDIIRVEYPDNIARIDVYNTSGQLMTTIIGNNQSLVECNISSWATGYYSLLLQTNSGKLITGQLVKR
jgi:hypothetical protein